MFLLVMSSDRHVFPGYKCMSTKPVGRLIVVGGAFVVVKRPKGMLIATRLVDELAELVCFAGPESAHTAKMPRSLPLLEIDMSAAVERSNKFISVPV